MKIDRIEARQVLDSRGNPTVEVDVELAGGVGGRAAVPSGASTGSHEAVELRDGGSRWQGKGVQRAVANVNTDISAHIMGREFSSLEEIDRVLIDLDGTPSKGRLGANAVLGTSLALARAFANASRQPLWAWIAEQFRGQQPPTLPVPMLNIVNGGEHANNALDVQEFMIVPHGFDRFDEALESAVNVFHTLKSAIDKRGLSTAVGDEGGFAPDLPSNTAALELIAEAITACGYDPGAEISIALDVAATELYDGSRYRLRGEGRTLDRDELVGLYESWCEGFPIVSIEDGMSEDDWDGWDLLTQRLGASVQLVGDDLFVTNAERIQRGIDLSVANALLVKVNQIGTLTETFEAMRLASSNGYRNVMSHRSGETEDPFIADLAVGTACGQIKTGAPSRSDRVAKYNQLLRIQGQLGDNATYARPFAVSVADPG